MLPFVRICSFSIKPDTILQAQLPTVSSAFTVFLICRIRWEECYLLLRQPLSFGLDENDVALGTIVFDWCLTGYIDSAHRNSIYRPAC